MSNISPPLEFKKLCDISYSRDLSDHPGDRVGHRRAGKTPIHPGYGDPASGAWWEQFVLRSVQVGAVCGSHAWSEALIFVLYKHKTIWQ